MSDSLVHLRKTGQALDYTSLLVCLDELQCGSKKTTYVPSLVENVIQVDEYNVVLGLKSSADSQAPDWLQLCWDPVGARIGMGHPPPRDQNNQLPYSFAAVLRSQLKGLALTKIALAVPTERIVELHFSPRLHDQPTLKLYLEVLGSRSNLILVDCASSSTGNRNGNDDATNTITAVAYQVGGSNSVRPLQTGGQYHFPPSGPGIYDAVDLVEAGVVSSHLKTVLNAAREALERGEIDDEQGQANTNANSKNRNNAPRQRRRLQPSSPITRVLVDLYQGMSPAMAYGMMMKMVEEQQQHTGQMAPVMTTLEEVVYNEALLTAVEEAVSVWARAVVSLRARTVGARASNNGQQEITGKEGLEKRSKMRLACVAASGPDGRFYPDFTSSNKSGGKGYSDGDDDDENGFLAFCRDYYEGRRVTTVFASQAADCQRRLHARAMKAEGLADKFAQSLLKASEENALSAQGLGDLVTAYTYAWKHGSGKGVPGRVEFLECFDFESSERVMVPIPEATSPPEYASSLYKKARKLRRSREVTKGLLHQAELQLEYVRDVAAALEGLIEEHAALLMLSDPTTIITSGSTDMNTNTDTDTAASLRRLERDLPLLAELVGEVADLEAAALLPESSAQYRQQQEGGEADNEGEEGGYGMTDDDEPVPVKSLRGKDKYLAHKEKVRARKNLVVQASASKGKKGGSKQKQQKQQKQQQQSGSSSSKGGRNKKALGGLTVLQPSDPDLAADMGSAVVVVGRSSKQNERISFQVAKDHHLWFHADGVPGSHVLLMLQPGQEASQTALQYAADVAAWHSKAKGDSSPSVSYTSPRHLKKVPGGGPGMVALTKVLGAVYGKPERGRQLMEKDVRE
jgi:predicted ribosome quality control (RQC) complex YloA/Tae2 family protein